MTTVGDKEEKGQHYTTTKNLPPRYPHYRATFKKDALWEGDENAFPRWLPCAFPDNGVRFSPLGAAGLLWDFSMSSPDKDQNNYLSTNSKLYGNYVPPIRKPIKRWYDAGWVEPTWFWEPLHTDLSDRQNKPLIEHPELFRLVASSEKLLLKKPGAADYDAVSVSACVTYPYTILVGLPQLIDIDKVGSIFNIKCTSCKLTNCIDSTVSGSVILIVRRPPYVLLPVDLGDEPWFDDSAIQIIRYATGLIRAKRFVTALILGITALIAIVTSFAVSTTALVKKMQTATFVNDLHRNVTLTLSEQKIIDLKLETRLNALEEVVLELGRDVANIKTRMATRCHANYDFICVTPLPYNAVEEWERTKAHLLGIWDDDNISYNIQELTSLITEMSKQHVDTVDLSGLTRSFTDGVKSLNPIDWTQYFIFIRVGILLLVVVLMIFPIVFRCFTDSIAQVQADLNLVLLKNKKGGTAAPAAEITELRGRHNA